MESSHQTCFNSLDNAMTSLPQNYFWSSWWKMTTMFISHTPNHDCWLSGYVGNEGIATHVVDISKRYSALRIEKSLLFGEHCTLVFLILYWGDTCFKLLMKSYITMIYCTSYFIHGTLWLDDVIIWVTGLSVTVIAEDHTLLLLETLTA